MRMLLRKLQREAKYISIDTDELPGWEVALGSINYLRIVPKKEHQGKGFY